MSASINNTVGHKELGRTIASSRLPMDEGDARKHLFDVMVRATRCSPMVFCGLLAWTNLRANSPR
jgi:hypothetical protein